MVDSDDWVDPEAYRKVLDFLREAIKEEEPLDMLISNYVYEKQGAKHKKVIQYHSILPENRYFGWNEIGHFGPSQNILMHSVIYRTQLLRDCGFELPKHTFYVDNIFVFWPLPYVKKMYYLDVDFYRYFIGRDDQSVNEKTMIKRIDQQLFVTKTMIDFFNPYDYWEDKKMCAKYLIHYIDIMMSVSTILLQISNTKENKEKCSELWSYLKEKNQKLYRTCKISLSGLCLLPRFISVPGYKIARKIYKFN